jgi:hypothetical protein
MGHNGAHNYTRVTLVDPVHSDARPLGKAYLDAGDEGGHGDRTYRQTP